MTSVFLKFRLCPGFIDTCKSCGLLGSGLGWLLAPLLRFLSPPWVLWDGGERLGVWAVGDSWPEGPWGPTMTMERPSSGPWSSVGSSIIILSVSSSPKVSREITTLIEEIYFSHQKWDTNITFLHTKFDHVFFQGGLQDWFNRFKMTNYITCDSVQLHIGVVIGQSLRMGSRLEHRSRSCRRYVGNLQGQRGLVESENA